MPTVVISAYNVATFEYGGGHLWVYLQYALGLRQIGCEVFWLERIRTRKDAALERAAVDAFLGHLARFGFGGKVLLYTEGPGPGAGGGGGVDGRKGEGDDRPGEGRIEFIGVGQAEAEAILERADLLLNFHYAINPALLGRFRKTALVDIDPGLLQLWMSTGQLQVPPHDLYCTIGETVGTPAATFPDCGVDWIRFRPPVCLDHWPAAFDPACERFSTVAGWWSGKWIKEVVDGREVLTENTKRAGFLPFADLPRHTSQALELALYLAPGDADERRMLEGLGWSVRHSSEVARTPEMYQAYIRASRGEFSCAKPSCMKFRNAWVSDRTICYLASGKPVVVQDTGPSAFLPNGEGMFRFSTIVEAADQIARVNADYARHCRAARALAESLFDARIVLPPLLERAI